MAIKDDGKVLVRYFDKDVGGIRHALGITSKWHHDIYEQGCPDGYELVWVEFFDWENNDGFKKAFSLAHDEISEFDDFVLELMHECI